jgi:hypothetical protein
MVVKQQSVKFADVVVIQFQILNVKKFLTRKSSENHQLKRKKQIARAKNPKGPSPIQYFVLGNLITRSTIGTWT